MNEPYKQDGHDPALNMGEMVDADAVGTVGNSDCGDMVRMWLKFREENGKKIIDKASFQSFGCQTALAVASMATRLLQGKTVEEARSLSSMDLSAPLGPLPPMKIHCGEMVEGALKAALDSDKTGPASSLATPVPSEIKKPNLAAPEGDQPQFLEQSVKAIATGKVRVKFLPPGS